MNYIPKCKILKQKLDAKEIEYKLIEDMDIIMKKAEEVSLQSLPFMIIENETYDFSSAVRYANEY